MGQLTTNFILLLTDAQYNYAAHIVLYQLFYNKIIFFNNILIIAIIITFFFSLNTNSQKPAKIYGLPGNNLLGVSNAHFNLWLPLVIIIIITKPNIHIKQLTSLTQLNYNRRVVTQRSSPLTLNLDGPCVFKQRKG